MESKDLGFKALLIAVVGLGLVLGGCSQINDANQGMQSDLVLNASPEPSSPDDLEPPPFNLTRYQYPENANYPPEGYKFVPIGANRVSRATDDPCNNDWEIGIVWYWWGGDVELEDETGIEVGSYAIPYWATWIAVTRPDSVEPWVEFEPHGLVFNYAQVARISWAECGLPEGLNPEDLTVWYYNEELNEYEYIGGTVYPEEMYVEYDIEHFSRYVVASEI